MALTVEVALMLYGGLGGWLGIAFAVYLYRIRPVPAHPAAVLGVFAMGFAMLMGTLLLSDALAPYGRAAPSIVLFFTYTLLLVAELALMAAHTHPTLFADISGWARDDPRLTHSGAVVHRDARGQGAAVVGHADAPDHDDAGDHPRPSLRLTARRSRDDDPDGRE